MEGIKEGLDHEFIEVEEPVLDAGGIQEKALKEAEQWVTRYAYLMNLKDRTRSESAEAQNLFQLIRPIFRLMNNRYKLLIRSFHRPDS